MASRSRALTMDTICSNSQARPSQSQSSGTVPRHCSFFPKSADVTLLLAVVIGRVNLTLVFHQESAPDFQFRYKIGIKFSVGKGKPKPPALKIAHPVPHVVGHIKS